MSRECAPLLRAERTAAREAVRTLSKQATSVTVH
jgi:hypothetical protein